jgi:hypothetical protein
MKCTAILFAAALGILTMGSLAHADSMTLTLTDNAASYGGPPPSATGPWATATFTQVSANEITLDLHPLAALGTSYIDSWGFNFAGNVGDLTIVPDANTAPKVDGYTSPKPITPFIMWAPAEEVYSFGFIFADSSFTVNPPNYGIEGFYSPADPFFTITSDVPISIDEFDTTGITSPFTSEALIKDTGGAVWGTSLGGVDGDDGGNNDIGDARAVPAPSAAAAGGVLIASLALWKWKQRSSRSHDSI